MANTGPALHLLAQGMHTLLLDSLRTLLGLALRRLRRNAPLLHQLFLRCLHTRRRLYSQESNLLLPSTTASCLLFNYQSPFFLLLQSDLRAPVRLLACSMHRFIACFQRENFLCSFTGFHDLLFRLLSFQLLQITATF